MRNFIASIFLCFSLVSCIKKSETSAPATEGVPGQRSGGTLVVGRPSDSVGLDPGYETDGESFDVAVQILDRLVTFKKESSEVIPSLAEKWEISPDGLT